MGNFILFLTSLFNLAYFFFTKFEKRKAEEITAWFDNIKNVMEKIEADIAKKQETANIENTKFLSDEALQKRAIKYKEIILKALCNRDKFDIIENDDTMGLKSLIALHKDKVVKIYTSTIANNEKVKQMLDVILPN